MIIYSFNHQHMFECFLCVRYDSKHKGSGSKEKLYAFVFKYFFKFKLFIYFTLQHCIGFALNPPWVYMCVHELYAFVELFFS